MAESNFKLTWTPEGGSKREWSFNVNNPGWDIRVQTEKATGWPWVTFYDRLTDGSALAMQALLWVLRKRDEPKLALHTVEPDFDELEPVFRCPDCRRWLAADDSDDEGNHGCTGKDAEPAADKAEETAGDEPGEA